MNIESIKRKIVGGWIGKKINFKPEAISTNAWALESLTTKYPSPSGGEGKGEGGEKRGDVFLTDFQTHGKGRLDRKWESASGKNILISLIDKKPGQENLTPQITLIAGLGFLEGLQSLFPKLAVTLKWPNDLLLDGKKIGGILIESHPTQPYLVVGLGLNVNMGEQDFSPEVQKTAASLSQKSGNPLEREPIIAACLNHYQKWRDLFDEKGSLPIIDAWKKKSSTLNRQVKVNEAQETYEGVAVDLDLYGFLVVETNGKRKTVISGDITLV